MKCCFPEHLGVGAGEALSLWRLCRSRVLARTLGGSGAPEPRPRIWLETTAQLCREVVHREAVGAELTRGGEMLANVAGGNRRSVGEAREDEQAVGGELARIFRREWVQRLRGRQPVGAAQSGLSGDQLACQRVDGLAGQRGAWKAWRVSK